MSTVRLNIAVVCLLVGWSRGCMRWFEEGERKPDGSLRCYQCDTTDPLVQGVTKEVCSLGNWKYANLTEKRNMIMQCPRRKSVFCRLMVDPQNSSYTSRGCFGPYYKGDETRKAHVGCFYTEDPTNSEKLLRACLCNTNLCNSSPTSREPKGYILKTPSMILLQVFITFCV